jgi:hypothetical protein
MERCWRSGRDVDKPLDRRPSVRNPDDIGNHARVSSISLSLASRGSAVGYDNLIFMVHAMQLVQTLADIISPRKSDGQIWHVRSARGCL